MTTFFKRPFFFREILKLANWCVILTFWRNMYLSSVASRKAMWKTSLFLPQPSKIAMWVFTILASSSSLHTQFEAAVGCRFDLPFFERKKQLFFLLPKYSLVVLNILQYYYHHSRRLKRRLWKFSVVNSTLLHPKALVVVVRAASSKKKSRPKTERRARCARTKNYERRPPSTLTRRTVTSTSSNSVDFKG